MAHTRNKVFFFLIRFSLVELASTYCNCNRGYRNKKLLFDWSTWTSLSNLLGVGAFTGTETLSSVQLGFLNLKTLRVCRALHSRYPKGTRSNLFSKLEQRKNKDFIQGASTSTRRDLFLLAAKSWLICSPLATVTVKTLSQKLPSFLSENSA